VSSRILSTSDRRLLLFRRVARAAAILAFIVVVLGAWVRLSAAGLGCPDWPGCYGHITVDQAAQNADAINQAFPQRPFVYHKAIKEMVHRYFASTLGLLIIVLAGMAVWNRRNPDQPVALPLALVALVVVQGLLGMWTVTLLLKPLIVVLHLIGGLMTLSLLGWLTIVPERRSVGPDNQRLRRIAATGIAVLALQIILGGWTSSNYAALACPDFPTCQNVMWPEMDVRDAFVLWRGLGIDYEGGVLNHPARVAIHFMHRLGAALAATTLGYLVITTGRLTTNPKTRRAALVLAGVLAVQLILGPVMVLHALPLPLATAHNAVAALLLLALVRLYRLLNSWPVQARTIP
jgi:cytochrome c oxidase assembly protein subunit 15